MYSKATGPKSIEKMLYKIQTIRQLLDESIFGEEKFKEF